MLGLGSVPVKKVVAVPVEPEGLEFKWTSVLKDIQVFDINKSYSFEELNESFLSINSDSNPRPIDFLASLAFMKCSYFFPMESQDIILRESELAESLSEALAGTNLSERLYMHSHLEKSKCEGVVKVEVRDDCYIWLDPIQNEILKSKEPKLLIPGAASTGKTALLQLKIVEILKSIEHCSIIVVLPITSICASRFFCIVVSYCSAKMFRFMDHRPTPIYLRQEGGSKH